ncbi:MAG: NAD(P)H-dependent oxidoreductase [Candidatus Saccharimonadales bacterium]
MNIVIIGGSVRPGNASARVSKWVENVAKNTLQDTEVSVVDLATLNLPRFEEAIPPMMNDQRDPSGALKQWLDALDAADGYVFVTPEYNHGMSGALKDAIDYIDHQIMKKPFIVVSHGGVGGARAVEQVKLVLNANIGAIPVPNSVNIFGYIAMDNSIDEQGIAQSDAVKKTEGPLTGALETLHWYATALKTARG